MSEQIISICEKIVNDILEAVTQERRREQSHTTTSPTCNIGEWVEDTSLGGGWKTCVVNTDGSETRMFYSPCGRLFNSFQEVEGYHQDIFSSYTSIKRKMSQVEVDGSLISPIKPVEVSLTKLSPEYMSLDSVNSKSEEDETEPLLLSDEEFRDKKPQEKKRKLCQEDICQIQKTHLAKAVSVPFPEEDETLPLRKTSQVEVNGSQISPIKPLQISLMKLRPEEISSDSVTVMYKLEEDETEPLLLSDEEFTDKEPQEKKSKLCLEDVYQETLFAVAKAVSFPASVEELLSACHGEWPMTTTDIVTSILGEVANMAELDRKEKAAVTREKIEKWYDQRNKDVFIRLFNAV